MSTPAPILEAHGIVKRYGHVVALDGADLELYPGEILAIIGDNGAGKSTLIKALSGALQPDEGELRLDGERVHFRSPRDARRAGIETVYQDLAVAPALDIASNIFLGRELRRARPAGHRAAHAQQGRDAARGHAPLRRAPDRHPLHEPSRSRTSPAGSGREWPSHGPRPGRSAS